MKALVIIWFITMLMDILLPFVIAPSYKQYDHMRHVLSVLGCRQSPVKQIYNGWCIVSGCIFFQGEHNVMGVFSAIGFGCTLGCFICFILGEKESFKHTVLRFGGLWQKLTMVACYIPFILYCIDYL